MTTPRQTPIGAGAETATGVMGLSSQAQPGQDTDPSGQSRSAGDFPLPGAVDVHAHYITPTYRQALVEAGLDHPDGMAIIPDWSADRAFALMDSTGIATAMLSVSSPGFPLNDRATTRRLVRYVNEEGAALVKAHPDRFGLFASLPLPDVEASIEEVRYAFDILRADGIALETNYQGSYLGDSTFAPLLAELDQREAVVHLHPTSPACWQGTSLGRPRPVIEFLFDTTRTITQLILDRVPETYPRIRFIVSHTGAALPVLADRIAAFATLESVPPVNVIAALRGLYYDVAGFPLPRALPALLNLVDPDKLLYGSDYPFTPEPVINALALQLSNTETLSLAEKRMMFSRNATSLFPRLA
jgi:6-methylsalicylate decarboxylase